MKCISPAQERYTGFGNPLATATYCKKICARDFFYKLSTQVKQQPVAAVHYETSNRLYVVLYLQHEERINYYCQPHHIVFWLYQ